MTLLNVNPCSGRDHWIGSQTLFSTGDVLSVVIKPLMHLLMHRHAASRGQDDTGCV